MQEFFNSEHATADKSGLEVWKFTKRGKSSEIKLFSQQAFGIQYVNVLH